MKVNKSNSFLATAKKSKSTSVLRSISSGETITPLMPGYKTRMTVNGRTVVRPTYFKFLRDFSSEFKTKKSLLTFQENVVSYLKLTGQEINEVASINAFTKYIKDLRVKNPNVTFKLREKTDIDLTKYTAQQLYTMYWTDRILHEHNERVDAAYKLQDQYPSERQYSPSKIDIARFNYDTGKLSRITSYDLYNYMQDERKLHVRSNEKFYVYNPVVDDGKLDLIYNHKAYGSGAADRFENRYDLFLHNLIYSAEEAGWDEAVDLIKWFIENGHGDELYDIYTSDPEFAIVFEYADNVDEMSSKQQNFVNVLNDKINEIINKEA